MSEERRPTPDPGAHETRFQELKRFARFSPAVQAAVRRVVPLVAPHFERIVRTFYDRLLEHEGARHVLRDERVQRRLQRTLLSWLVVLFRGPYDEVYYQIRARIGRVHVAIGLEPRYMVLGMSLLREELCGVVAASVARADGPDRAGLIASHAAISRICDIELAIMLETFSKEYAASLKRRERLATIGQITASISHEVQNPLSVIASSVYVLRSSCLDAVRELAPDAANPLERHLNKISRNVEQAGAIVSALLAFMRNRKPDYRTVAVNRVVEEAAREVRLPDRCRLSLELGAEVGQAMLDPVQVGSVVSNLVRNAAEAMVDGGAIRVRTEGDPAEVRVVVEDEGPGIDRDLLPHLFEPLRTTKEVGTGLGLALCRSIVLAHGGHIAARNHRRGGAEVVFCLPRDPRGGAL